MVTTCGRLRNIALVGASGSGKTTLAEALLVSAGVKKAPGCVESGTTTSDYLDIEKEHKYSINSSLLHFESEQADINIIDTPGTAGLLGRAITALPAVETALIVVDAHAGISPVTRRLEARARESGTPRMFVINKSDSDDDLGQLLADLQEAFGKECLPMNLPCDGGKGVVGCFRIAEGDSDLGSVADFHEQIVDQVVEVDEELMAKYLEQGEIDPAELIEPFSKAMKEGHLAPVFFCSATEGIGIKELLHNIAELAPSPEQGVLPSIDSISDNGRETLTLNPDPEAPLVASVFKVSSDKFLGKVALIRILQGSLKAGDSPNVGDDSKGTRLSHLHRVHGEKTREVSDAGPGDIVAIAKVDRLNHGEVLHDGSLGKLSYEPVGLPKPMYGLAIQAASRKSEEKMSEVLRKLCDEDPTLILDRVVATGETVLRGLGEQHLKLKLEILKNEYGVEVETHPPAVAYSETVLGSASGHHRHKKQSGGAGQFGEVMLEVRPATDEDELIDGLCFVDDTFGGSVPKQFMPAIEKGIRQAMETGVIAGYQFKNVTVNVKDGKHHPVDSKEVAFISAGKKAFVQAVQSAKPALLEPIVKMEVTIPAEYIGDISSDLSGKRGRLLGTDTLPGNFTVMYAEAPLSEVAQYTTTLRSITAGSGSYTMEFAREEPAPEHVKKERMAAFKPAVDED